jgi:hypothetical protein
LRDVPVEHVEEGGFWIGTRTAGCEMYVFPAEGSLIHVTLGELVDLQGEFRFRRVPAAGAQARLAPYVYAYIVRRVPDDGTVE